MIPAEHVKRFSASTKNREFLDETTFSFLERDFCEADYPYLQRQSHLHRSEEANITVLKASRNDDKFSLFQHFSVYV